MGYGPRNGRQFRDCALSLLLFLTPESIRPHVLLVPVNANLGMHPGKKVRAMSNFFMFVCQIFGCKNFSHMIFPLLDAPSTDLDLATELAYSLRCLRVVRNDMEGAESLYRLGLSCRDHHGF